MAIVQNTEVGDTRSRTVTSLSVHYGEWAIYHCTRFTRPLIRLVRHWALSPFRLPTNPPTPTVPPQDMNQPTTQ